MTLVVIVLEAVAFVFDILAVVLTVKGRMTDGLTALILASVLMLGAAALAITFLHDGPAQAVWVVVGAVQVVLLRVNYRRWLRSG